MQTCRPRRLPLALALVLALPATLAAPGLVASDWDSCEHRAERNLTLDVDDARALGLIAAAGELELRGEAGLTQVIVRGTACASDAERLAGIQLQQRREGDRLMVAVKMPEPGSNGNGWFNQQYQRLDLEVRVPAGLALDITDSSGDLRLRNIGSASVQDSSGDIDIEDVAGELLLVDSSGDIDVQRVGGLLHVRSDSSGDIDATDIGGDALVSRDSSGDITLDTVRGNAEVKADSSGSIRFVDVDGDALVGTDGSGGIEALRIGRDFRVERDGSGGISHRDVAGVVSVPDQDD